MLELAKGEKLMTISERSVTVLEELGRGGQGIVYRVLCGGRERALKWYYRNSFSSPAQRRLFYDNLCDNALEGIVKGAEDQFVWPFDVVKSREHGTFGYIMNLIPADYYEFSEYQLGRCFSGYRARVNAMIQLAEGFRTLHNAGYKYQDINNGNVFIRPEDGSVLICDNDNASRENRANGVVGKDRYMAPEVLLGQKMPDQTTDRFSLAVLLFILACKEHPLVGRKVLSYGILSEELQVKAFGSEPLFIFDKDNPANRPDENTQKNVYANWRAVPQYVRELFMRSFSEAAMKYDHRANRYSAPRVTELEWLQALLRWRNSLIGCSCKNRPEWHAKSLPAVCARCGRTLDAAWTVNIGDYSIPMALGMKLTRFELGHLNAGASMQIIAETANNPKAPDDPVRFGLRNMTDKAWKRILPDGSQKELPPGAAAMVIDQMTVVCGTDERDRFQIRRVTGAGKAVNK